MLIIIICTAIAFIWGMADGTSVDGPVVGFFLGLFAAFWGACAGLLVAALVGTAVYGGSHWEPQRPVPLVSLADGAEIHGQFFLGSGYIDQSPSYTWYESNGRNSFVRRDVPADEATIHYSDSTPRYVIRVKKRTGPSLRTWGFNTVGQGEQKYDFYVPKGSIVQSYKLDNR